MYLSPITANRPSRPMLNQRRSLPHSEPHFGTKTLNHAFAEVLRKAGGYSEAGQKALRWSIDAEQLQKSAQAFNGVSRYAPENLRLDKLTPENARRLMSSKSLKPLFSRITHLTAMGQFALTDLAASFPNLKSLRIQEWTEDAVAGLAPLSPLQNIRSLSLWASEVSDKSLETLPPNLETLAFVDNRSVSRDGLTNLSGLQKLKNLILTSCRVRYVDAAALKAAKPQLTIDVY